MSLCCLAPLVHSIHTAVHVHAQAGPYSSRHDTTTFTRSTIAFSPCPLGLSAHHHYHHQSKMPLGPTRRLILLLILGAGIVSVLYISSFRPPIASRPAGVVNPAQAPHDIGSATLTGPAIAPKLGNETAK